MKLNKYTVLFLNKFWNPDPTKVVLPFTSHLANHPSKIYIGTSKVFLQMLKKEILE